MREQPVREYRYRLGWVSPSAARGLSRSVTGDWERSCVPLSQGLVNRRVTVLAAFLLFVVISGCNWLPTFTKSAAPPLPTAHNSTRATPIPRPANGLGRSTDPARAPKGGVRLGKPIVDDDGAYTSGTIRLASATEQASPPKDMSKNGGVELLPPPRSDRPSQDGQLLLADVIQSVYASYPLLEAVLWSRQVAGGEVLSAYGAFDLKMKGGGTSGPLGFYNTHRYGAEITQPLFIGGEVFGKYRIGRGSFQPWYLERQTNDGGEFSTGFRLPLAQGRAIDYRRANLFRSMLGRDAAEPLIHEQLIEFVREASYAYWHWIAAGEQLRIARSLLKLAEDRNQGIKKRVEAGDLPRIELTDNQRLIVSREAKVIAAQRKLQEAAIKLSLFLRDESGEPVVPDANQLPGSFPEPQAPDFARLEQDIAQAQSRRPEPAALALLRAQLQVDLDQAQNLYLPNVDVQVYASQDISGPKRDKKPFELEASLQMSMPLQRRLARGKIQALQGKLAQVTAKLRFTNDKIAAEVRRAYAALSASFLRVEKAKASFDLARTMEEAERRKFALGNSNLLLVNLRELAAAEAEASVVQAYLEYFLAEADYRAALALDRIPQDTPEP